MVRYFSLLAGAALLASSGAAFAYTGQKYAHDAKITLAQARETALKAQSGTITDQELERESGGTGLRYSFDIKTPTGVQEVGVDAQTGAVLENKREGHKPD